MNKGKREGKGVKQLWCLLAKEMERRTIGERVEMMREYAELRDIDKWGNCSTYCIMNQSERGKIRDGEGGISSMRERRDKGEVCRKEGNSSLLSYRKRERKWDMREERSDY